MRFSHLFIATLSFLLPITVHAQDSEAGIKANLSQFSDITSPIYSGDSTLLSTLIGNLLPLSLVFAGLLLLLMLIRGGFTMLSNPTNPDAQGAGKARITWALVGFFVLFCSYWLAQILEIVFNINIV